jgi:Mg-chelatase subunit ChlD
MTRVSLLFPELLLLLLPLLALLFWRGRSSALGAVVRALIAICLALLAAVPMARLGGRGVDIVVVVDLSRSMPADSRDRALEIIRLLEERRQAGDRVGVVIYGREARVERLPEALGQTSTFVQQIDPDGSDLGGAISLAASLIPPQRPGRVLVLSDGEATGASVAAAAHEMAERGVPVDFRPINRGAVGDIAVESLELPGLIDEREPFQFSAWVRTDRSVDSEAVLFRNGVEIARESKTFAPGATQLKFRDLVDRPGVARYRLELQAARDRVPENNVGEGVLRVEAPATILLVNAHGGPDNLSRALASGKLRVTTVAPQQMPRDVGALLTYRAVILENVPASALGLSSLAALTQYTTDLGGGLLLTGGRASFGVGGYFKSELDPYLPVSMEIKNEHRKLSLAMAVALDRSGSMTQPVSGGRTKMDLANLGTCAAIETLGPFDEVGVIAVDSAPHVVTPLVAAKDTQAICNQVRTIQSMGGGIFTYTALVTAANMVQQSNKGTRHIVLFADAADAEEPGEYVRLLERIRPLGITVSVIGLGTDADPDAEFLKDVAKRGGGRILFTENADELPQLFAQEAITVARSSFINEPTPTRALPDMVLLGDLPASAFPGLDGYNLTYLRPGATMGVVTTDEYKAPVLAFWHRGLGRIGSLTAEVDGTHSQRLNAWPGFGGFAVGLGRWLLGGEPPVGVRATLDRRGGEGIVRVELDPDRAREAANDTRAATATIVPPGADAGSSRRLPLTWVGEDTLEARFPLHRAGAYFGAVQLGGGDVLALAPLSLPYSPEFEPRADPEEGRKALAEMARISGGIERTAWNDVFSASRLRDRQIRDLVLPLTLIVLLMHVGEVAGRRLLLFAAATARLRALRLPRLRLPSVRGVRSGARMPAPEADQVIVDGPAPSDAAAPVSVGSAPVARPAGSPLSRAKAKARDRLGR